VSANRSVGSSRPNFWKFDDNVLYEIVIDNTGDAVEDLTFQFRFRTEIRNPNTFLYNTGPVSSLDDPRRCCDSPRRSRRRRAHTGLASSAETSPVFRTARAWETTSSISRCGRWPAPRR
jgi:hypothetical protein